MLATRGAVLAGGEAGVPAGAEWVHEVKWDGVRLLVEVPAEGGRVRMWSRNENDVSPAYPELQGLTALGRDALLDGEVVALADGVPSFRALAERMHVRDSVRAARLAETRPVTLILFDLLRLDGRDLLDRPLGEPREALERLGLDDDRWRVPPTYADGRALLEAAEQQGLEGIVSKRLSSRYHPGRRSRDWLKFPIRPTASYLVGGYRHEKESDSRLGALLVGEPGPGGLQFRGKVGSGVAGRAGVRLGELLRPLARPESPFATELPRVDRVGTVWVEPTVIVDVQYLTLTADGRLRQPAYRGVRTDLDPDDLLPDTMEP
jgi:bifunctional non-homologous end joining protein LigD